MHGPPYADLRLPLDSFSGNGIIFPAAIALILLALFGTYFHHNRTVYIWVTSFTWTASLFDFFKALPEQVQMLFHLDKAVEFAENFLPLFNLNLGWILPAAIGLLIGLLSDSRTFS